MNYGREENLLSNISMCLVASATFCLIEITEGRWILRVMKEFFLVTPQTTELIENLVLNLKL